MDGSRRDGPASPAAARDAALGRLWRLRRWLAVGSFAAAGILAGVVAQAKPGKSSSTASSTTGSVKAAHSGGSTAGGSAARLPSGSISGAGANGSTSLSPPPAAPAPAPAAPAAPTVSGGS